MKSKINTTLLQKLFENPTPLDRKKQIFQSLSSRMFPCREVFVSFLITVDASERLELAKHIIQRLCFEANFPPSYFGLLNLLEFENDTPNKSGSSQYIPQDHFSHIVYTYLLGLYLFFYSPSINRELTREFIRKRKESGFDLALDATKDFISFWKYFCLFHDIAYPIETLYKKSKNGKIVIQNKDAFDKYLKWFNKMQYTLAHEILVEGMTKFLVVWQMLHDENNMFFSEVLDTIEGDDDLKTITGSQEKVEKSEIMEQFKDFKSIDKIHCFEHLKMLTGYFSASDYIIVLFDAFSEQPIAIKTGRQEKAKYYILHSQHNLTSEFNILKYLDHEDYLLDHQFFVRYYFKDVEDIIPGMQIFNCVGERFSEQDYDRIIRRMRKLFEENHNFPGRIYYFEQITTSYELNAYIYQCYKTLLQYFCPTCEQTMKDPDHLTLTVIDNNQRIINEYLDNHFVNFFQDTLISDLPFIDFRSALEKLRNPTIPDRGSGNNFSSKTIQGLVDVSIEALFNVDNLNEYKRNLKKRISGEISRAIEEEKDINGIMVDFFYQCYNQLFSKIERKDINFLNQCGGINIQDLLSFIELDAKAQKYIGKVGKWIAQKTMKGEAEAFGDFINLYKTKNYLYDHGIYGALVYLISFEFYEKVIKNIFDPSAKSLCLKNIMSTLCWNVENKKYQNKLIEDYEYIGYAVFKSIFCHNLYPDVIYDIYGVNMQWTYDFFKEPSTYFGMLVDALQVWDRKKYYHYSTITWQPMFSSDNYDITIEENKIVLHIKEYGNNMSSIIKRFINGMDSYLSGFSSFVSININS